jgi:hypothetical protein
LALDEFLTSCALRFHVDRTLRFLSPRPKPSEFGTRAWPGRALCVAAPRSLGVPDAHRGGALVNVLLDPAREGGAA